jgi:hypothetical protein
MVVDPAASPRWAAHGWTHRDALHVDGLAGLTEMRDGGSGGLAEMRCTQMDSVVLAKMRCMWMHSPAFVGLMVAWWTCYGPRCPPPHALKLYVGE